MSIATDATPAIPNEIQAATWPRKVDLFGVGYTPTTYDEATNLVVTAAKRKLVGVVACHAAHAVVTCTADDQIRRKANAFDMITPDGQPVRWALNWLHGARLSDRVYGPELTTRICAQAASAGVPIYLYGGSPQVIEKLRDVLLEKYVDLQIAGYESPPFRDLTPEEDQEVIDRINSSGAGIVFIGLGCPKQDLFAYEHRESIRAIQVCVGAAFDFHAGEKPMAPAWMQRLGMEWLFRLFQEPKRLWRRYLFTNTIFTTKVLLALANLPRVRKQRRETRSLNQRGTAP